MRPGGHPAPQANSSAVGSVSTRCIEPSARPFSTPAHPVRLDAGFQSTAGSPSSSRSCWPECSPKARSWATTSKGQCEVAIAVKLDDLLHHRRMTLTELADRFGLTLANLSILKTGRARAIRFSTLEAIWRCTLVPALATFAGSSRSDRNACDRRGQTQRKPMTTNAAPEKIQQPWGERQTWITVPPP